MALPHFPEALGYLWQAYLRLRRRMAGGFAGPNPVGWQDIDAFIRRGGLRLAPWEIEILEGIDDRFVHRDVKKTDDTESRPMSEKLFDAVFA